MAIGIEITGDREAMQALQKLAAAGRRAITGALKKGAGVIVKEMRRRAPVGKTKTLKKRIRVKASKVLRQGEMGAAIAKASAPHTHLNELGTQPRKTTKGKATGRMKPRPFVRQAADAKRAEAEALIGAEFGRQLGIEGEKLRTQIL